MSIIKTIEVKLVRGDRGRDTFVGKTLETGKIVFFKDLMLGLEPNYSEKELQNMSHKLGDEYIITVHKIVEYKGYVDAVIDVRQASSVKIKTKEAEDFAADMEALAYRETLTEQENVKHENSMMSNILKRREDERLNSKIGTIEIVDIDTVNDYMKDGLWKLVSTHAIADEIQFIIQKSRI